MNRNKYCWPGPHQFIWNHISLSWPQTSSVPPAVTATSFPVCDHTGKHLTALCLIRPVGYMWDYGASSASWSLYAAALVASSTLWYPRSYLGTYHLPRQWVENRIFPQPHNICEVCSIPPAPTCTLPLLLFFNRTVVFWFLEDPRCLSSSRPLHVLFPLLERFSLPRHSSSSSWSLHSSAPKHHFLSRVILTSRLGLGISWFS